MDYVISILGQNLGMAVLYIFGLVKTFFDYPFPGTSISVGKIGVAVLALLFMYRYLKTAFTGGDFND